MRARQVVCGIAVCAVMMLPLTAAAAPDVNLKAKTYKTNLVTAMDECASAVTNVGGVGACPPSNATTDGTPFTIGRITIRASTSNRQVSTLIKSSSATPSAGLANRLIHTVIILRVTRTTGAPPATWVDQVLDCPDIAVSSNGNAIQKVSLGACGLAPELAANTTNKEILGVMVVDSSTGDVIAVPGLRLNH